MTARLGTKRAILAIVLAGAFVTYGGVSLFVAFFVLAPMGHALFKAANIPHRLMAAAIALGTSTFTMSAMPGTPAIQNAIPMPLFGTNPFAAPGLGLTAPAIMLGFGLWWLTRAEAKARRAGEVHDYTDPTDPSAAVADGIARERATTAREFDPGEIARGARVVALPPFVLAALPLVTVVSVNSRP
jgi:H+/gluconate symporter-like permease